MKKYDGWVVISYYTKIPTLFPWTFALTRKGAIEKWGVGWERGRKAGWQKVVKVKFVEMDKMERKKTVLLNLIDDWEKLCKKSLSKLSVKRNPHTCGFISGELKAIVIMRKFIDEAWRQ